jgi:uncharacterized protein (TIGR02271 family)
MTQANYDDFTGWIGRTAVDPNGDKVGKIEDIYADDDTGQPEWLAVHTGTFGSHVSFVPLQGAQVQGDSLVLGYDKGLVKDAPRAEADGHLSEDEEDRLYQYYGMGAATTARRENGRADDDIAAGNGAGHDTSGPNTDDAMTRSEEEVQIGTRRREAGRARLRKWVETEQVEQTVPVQREEVRVVREPISDANRDAALSGAELSSEEHEVVLHEEEVDVQKRVVPKERIRLETETVTEQVPVTEEVRKERITTDADGGAKRA